MGENESISLLDINGNYSANENDVYKSLMSMSLTSELTKSTKGLYHVQINPAYGEDKNMTRETWIEAAELLEKEAGFSGQRRVILLHTKKSRTHAHVVFERYDHEKKIMKSDSFSRLAQDRARKAMELAFNHEPTPDRNKNRPDMKKYLSGLWQKITTGSGFIKEAKKAGYLIAAGLQRRPFMVVDQEGRSFDLVRQLENVKTKEVRERLKGEKLISEKEAIEMIRQKQKLAAVQKKDIEKANDNSTKERTATLFAESRNEAIKDDPQRKFEIRKKELFQAFKTTGDLTVPAENIEAKKQSLANAFVENKKEQLTKDTEKMKRDFIKIGKIKEKDRGLDYS